MTAEVGSETVDDGVLAEILDVCRATVSDPEVIKYSLSYY